MKYTVIKGRNRLNCFFLLYYEVIKLTPKTVHNTAKYAYSFYIE